MLTQVVYTSRPRFDPGAPKGQKTLEEIVAAAKRNNSQAGITGYLLVGQEQLAQVLEGEAKSVGQALRRILADSRHESVQVLDMRLVPERSFARWSMGIVHNSDILPVARDSVRLGGNFDHMTADDFLRLAGSGADIR